MDIYAVVVGECGISPTYFFNEMTENEALTLLDVSFNKKKTTWEQVRYIAYILMVSQGAQVSSPTDIFLFDWEKETEEIPDLETLEKYKKDLINLIKSQK